MAISEARGWSLFESTWPAACIEVVERSKAGHDLGMLAESRLPSFDDLVLNIKLVREKGLSNLRGYAVPALEAACRVLAADPHAQVVPADIEALLHRAADHIGGGRSEEAARYTIGLVQGTRMWSATERRAAAARAQGVSKERFRKGYEPKIIAALAEGVISYLDNSRQARQAVDNKNRTGEPIEMPNVRPMKVGFEDYVLLRTLDTAEEYTLGRLLPTAKTMLLYSRSPISVLTQYSRAIVGLIRRGGSLRMIFPADHVNVGDFIYPMEASGRNLFDHNLGEVKRRVAKIKADLGPAAERAEFRQLSALPPYGLACVYPEDTGLPRMMVQMSLLFTRTERDRPLLCLDNTSPWFRVFESEFEECWTRGVAYREGASNR